MGLVNVFYHMDWWLSGNKYQQNNNLLIVLLTINKLLLIFPSLKQLRFVFIIFKPFI